MAILREIEPPNTAPTDFVFTGAAAGGRINHQAMRLLLRELGLDYDVHGVRTTFKSWALDNLKHPLDIPAVELALDHAIGGKVAKTYRDTSLIGHRRILNERWSCFLRGVAYKATTRCPPVAGRGQHGGGVASRQKLADEKAPPGVNCGSRRGSCLSDALAGRCPAVGA